MAPERLSNRGAWILGKRFLMPIWKLFEHFFFCSLIFLQFKLFDKCSLAFYKKFILIVLFGFFSFLLLYLSVLFANLQRQRHYSNVSSVFCFNKNNDGRPKPIRNLAVGGLGPMSFFPRCVWGSCPRCSRFSDALEFIKLFIRDLQYTCTVIVVIL